MDLEKIKNDIKPLVENNELYLYSIDYKKKDEINVLEVVVDKKGFCDIDDVEKVTNSINEYLDKEDPISEEYSLEVMSRGLEKDFEFDDALYYIGENVEVKTFDQVHRGILEEKTNDELVLKSKNNKKIKINVNDIEKIQIVVKF